MTLDNIIMTALNNASGFEERPSERGFKEANQDRNIKCFYSVVSWPARERERMLAI